MAAYQWCFATERIEHHAKLARRECIACRFELVHKECDVRMLLLCESFVVAKGGRQAGVTLFAGKQAVCQHQDFRGING